MNFLVDAQLPKRLSTWLASQGHDAIHTQELLLKNRTPDDEVSAVADAGDRIVITKDANFVTAHLLRKKPRKVLAVRAGNISNDALLALFALHLAAIEEAFSSADYVELTPEFLIAHRVI